MHPVYEQVEYNGNRYLVVPQLRALGLLHVLTTIDVNMSLYQQDEAAIVQAFQSAKEAAGLSDCALFVMEQIHSATVVPIRSGTEGKTSPSADKLWAAMGWLHLERVLPFRHRMLIARRFFS